MASPADSPTHALESQTSPAPPGSDVKPRDVNYQYAGTDPEQVTALTNVSGGQPFATYTYDAAGNQKTRCYGAVTTPTCTRELTEYVYDGRDQLRRATKKLNGVVQGSEEYWYDNDGQRIAIVKRDPAGNKTELIGFNHDTEAHYDGLGNIVHAYSHLSLGTPVARVDRTSPTATTVEYQFHGLASSTLAAVDQGGTVNASFGLRADRRDYRSHERRWGASRDGGSQAPSQRQIRRRCVDTLVLRRTTSCDRRRISRNRGAPAPTSS